MGLKKTMGWTVELKFTLKISYTTPLLFLLLLASLSGFRLPVFTGTGFAGMTDPDSKFFSFPSSRTWSGIQVLLFSVNEPTTSRWIVSWFLISALWSPISDFCPLISDLLSPISDLRPLISVLCPLSSDSGVQCFQFFSGFRRSPEWRKKNKRASE